MAQSQAAGHGFANFWMHNGMVTYAGEKMSKSIGNTVSPAEMLELAPPRVVRYYLGQAQYRSVLDYQPTSLQEAAAAVERIDGFISRANRALAGAGTGGSGAGQAGGADQQVPAAFAAAMDDDLNVPQALAALHDTVRAGNTALTDGDFDAAGQALAGVTAMLDVLGLDATATPPADEQADAALGVLVEAQLAARAEARAGKDWASSDAIRDALAAAGVVVEDGADGARWSLKRS
jgi:cysteinyl-tRNA synthetase